MYRSYSLESVFGNDGYIPSPRQSVQQRAKGRLLTDFKMEDRGGNQRGGGTLPYFSLYFLMLMCLSELSRHPSQLTILPSSLTQGK